MRLREFDKQRLNDLEEILEIEYEKLATFEKDIQITSSSPKQFELKQLLKREVMPSIRRHLTEYTQILSQNLEVIVIPEAAASSTLEQVSLLMHRIQGSQSIEQQDDLMKLIVDIRQKLDDPGKAAAAKLKIALPVIPLIASYELEVDTEAFLVKTWQKINTSFKEFWR